MIRKLVRQMLLAQIFSALTVSLCLLIDNIMIGRFLGVEAIAAYGLANPILLVIGAIGLAICIALCACTTMKNHRVLQWTTVAASVLTGWILIFLHHAVFSEARALYQHAERVREAQRETYTGTFEQTDTVLRVRKGITLRRVNAHCGGRDTVLNVSEVKAKRLPKRFSGTVEAADFFIVTAEVNGDA